MKNRPEALSGLPSRRSAASESSLLVTDVSLSPCPALGRADRSHSSIPCERPVRGAKYQCDAAPIVWMPASWKRSATKVFERKYELKCPPSRWVSLGYLPIKSGPRLLPVYEARL